MLIKLYSILLVWNNFCRKIRFFRYRKKFRDKKVTLLSKNCLAGCIYHTLGMEFCSPTINIFFKGNGFYHFVENLPTYINIEIEEVFGEEYPAGVIKADNLPDVIMLFVHYKSFDEAKIAWDKRKKRIDYNNLIVFDSIRDFEIEHINLFNSLSCLKYGLVFDKKYENEYLSYSKYLNSDKYDESEILSYKGFLGKRKFDKLFFYKKIKKLFEDL